MCGRIPIPAAQALRRSPSAVALSFQLRFGDWNDLEVAYQLTRAVQGMADAATMLGVPVVAGELNSQATVGLYPRVTIPAHPHETPAPPRENDVIALLGRMTDNLSGSLYAGGDASLPPPIDLVMEGRLIELLRQVPAAAPLGRGGLLITLARCCARAGIGARVSLPKEWSSLSQAAVLFGEAQSRSLVFLSRERLEELRSQAEPLGLPLADLGTAGGQRLAVEGVIDLDLKELK
jgi:phosphoribosylformylglycinamidine synthase subunit PurL